MSRSFGYTKHNKTANYYRSGVTADDFRLVMEGQGWMTVSQVVALLGWKIPPEAKMRRAELRESKAVGMRNILRAGERDIVRDRLRTLSYHGRIEKDGIGKESKFRWVEVKDSSPGQDSPRRRHAKPEGTR